MINKKVVLFSAVLAAIPSVCLADSVAPLGVASAYNLVALGYNGIDGSIIANTDVTGRIAAASTVSGSMTLGSSLNSDPWGSNATYGLVATTGLGSGTQINMNGGGKVYAPGSNGNINFNEPASQSGRVTSGSSGIDFSSLRTTLDNESLQLAALTATGQVLGTNTPGSGNPSFFVLKGTDPVLNVFNITAAEFASSNNPLDIIAPVGSTIIINVDGTDPTLGAAIYYNGVQHSGDDAADEDILFNFATASTLTLDQGFSASVLAPFAILTNTGQIGGNFIAAQINSSGEVHNVEFNGTLPGDPGTLTATPEPGTLVLLGTGVLSLAGVLRKRKR